MTEKFFYRGCEITYYHPIFHKIAGPDKDYFTNSAPYWSASFNGKQLGSFKKATLLEKIEDCIHATFPPISDSMERAAGQA